MDDRINLLPRGRGNDPYRCLLVEITQPLDHVVNRSWVGLQRLVKSTFARSDAVQAATLPSQSLLNDIFAFERPCLKNPLLIPSLRLEFDVVIASDEVIGL